VSYRRKPIVSYLAVVVCTVVVGCGRGGDGDKSPTTAINGGNAASPTTGETRGQAKSTDSQHPVVVIETTLGNIAVRLDAEKAYLTVDNFLSYVNASHYDQTIVHQAYKGQLFLAGGYDAHFAERPTRPAVFNEAHNGLKNRRGTIAMARLPDSVQSATCQFFINVADNPMLDFKDRSVEGYGYCVFGEVTDGMDVADRIADAPVQDMPEFDRTPVPAIVIKSIRQNH
jgi:cyclophilin family peptidyl-prolyl cis-trans isomerase